VPRRGRSQTEGVTPELFDDGNFAETGDPIAVSPEHVVLVRALTES
jgi:hypothetical protein